MAKLGSEIYRAVAVALLDWLLEAGPVLLVGVDEGALLHSFGPEPAHEETAAVSRAKVQEGGGGGRELKRQAGPSVPCAEEALAESRRLQVEAVEALESVACTAQAMRRDVCLGKVPLRAVLAVETPVVGAGAGGGEGLRHSTW